MHNKTSKRTLQLQTLSSRLKMPRRCASILLAMLSALLKPQKPLLLPHFLSHELLKTSYRSISWVGTCGVLHIQLELPKPLAWDGVRLSQYWV